MVRLPAATYSDQLPAAPGLKLLLLEDVQDPGNVGTLIRTAAALHFSGVILTEKCADPFGPKCVQSTAGSVLAVWLRRTAAYLDHVVSLQEQGYTLAAADLEGTAEPLVLGDCQKLVLALGHEASGPLTGIAQSGHDKVCNPNGSHPRRLPECRDMRCDLHVFKFATESCLIDYSTGGCCVCQGVFTS